MPSETIKLHDFQSEAYWSNKPIVVACSGIQGGKTKVGALKCFKWAEEAPPNSNFIVASPDYPISAQATWPGFMEFFRGTGTWHGTDRYYELPTGTKFWRRSMRDPWSCEGIRDVMGIWGDEAGKFSRLAHENLMGRAAFKEAPIIYTTTPYALNWLYKDVYKECVKGNRPDVEFIQWRSIDSPYFPEKEYKRQKELLDPRLFAMKYEGTFQKMSGLVFPDIDEGNYENVHNWDLRHFKVYAGVDFGHTNPCAIVVRVVKNDGKYDYQVSEHYQSHMTIGNLIEKCKELQKLHGVTQFVCDSEDPGRIAELQNAGLPATGIRKYPNCLVDFIAWHNEIIRTKVYKMFRGCCPNTEDEYNTYHYPEMDEKKEMNEPEKPVDANNHAMTANMYVTAHARHTHRKVLETPKYDWKNPLEVNTVKDWYSGYGTTPI